MYLNKNYYKVNSCKLNHGFFTRLHGFSKNQFKSLNCSVSSGDNKSIVNRNRLKALKNLKLDNKKLILIKQTHSSKVIKINKFNLDKKLEADGMITSLKNVVLGVLTADCAPIFLYDNKNQIICCLHSGWRGTLKNISMKAIKLIDKENIKRENLCAIIGPCLSTNNYEVDKIFEQKFIKENGRYSNFFKYKNNKKSYFNLRGLINYQLKELGIKKVYNVKLDTYTNKTLFFSHRRSTHNGKKLTGRLINLISLA